MSKVWKTSVVPCGWKSRAVKNGFRSATSASRIQRIDQSVRLRIAEVAADAGREVARERPGHDERRREADGDDGELAPPTSVVGARGDARRAGILFSPRAHAAVGEVVDDGVRRQPRVTVARERPRWRSTRQVAAEARQLDHPVDRDRSRACLELPPGRLDRAADHAAGVHDIRDGAAPALGTRSVAQRTRHASIESGPGPATPSQTRSAM